jgi:hypothetical protein
VTGRIPKGAGAKALVRIQKGKRCWTYRLLIKEA